MKTDSPRTRQTSAPGGSRGAHPRKPAASLAGRRTAVDGLGRAGGAAVPPTLAALGGLHAAWALGSNWPAGSERALADRVLGAGTEMPPEWATWLVAIGLGGAAMTVRTAAADQPPPVVRRLARALAAVFLIRGTLFPSLDLIRGRHGRYERLDRTVYSPLCLALGAGTAAVAARGGADR